MDGSQSFQNFLKSECTAIAGFLHDGISLEEERVNLKIIDRVIRNSLSSTSRVNSSHWI
jgi:hypothetical protein